MSEHNDADPTLAPEPWADLHDALRAGDADWVRALIEAGADVRYKRKKGYDALIDAVHSHEVDRNPRLLDVLRLLVEHGADLSGESDYSETGLRVLSRIGRFDAVRLLLAAGADRSQLQWTRLHEAVALGTLADVEAAIDAGVPLEARDWWDRTAWLIAILTGDLAKGKLLRDRGADPNARGRCEDPATFYAIKGGHAEVLRWLVKPGADVNQTNEFGTTALIQAVASDDRECVDILLATGADVSVDANGTAVSCAQSREVIQRLLDAGADPRDLDCKRQRILIELRADREALAAVSPDEFRRAFTRRFGANNPERMREPFWEATVRAGASAYGARKHFGAEQDLESGPVWCADRFGQSLTLLPDGRAIQIGGEHEDHYDPDFYVYNDVFALGPGGELAIYGYPEDVFPPTDFHTATLVGDAIYVIGSLGYGGTRRFGETPVYRLDVRTLRMDRLDVHGDAPGWIYKHRAAALGRHAIRVWGGTVASERDGEELHDPPTPAPSCSTWNGSGGTASDPRAQPNAIDWRRPDPDAPAAIPDRGLDVEAATVPGDHLSMDPAMRRAVAFFRQQPARPAASRSSQAPISSPDFADTASASIPGRTACRFRSSARASNSTAAARSTLVTTTTSAVLKTVGYLSGLSSPSVTDRRTTRSASPRSNVAGQTRLPTFSTNRKSRSSGRHPSSAPATMSASRWQTVPVVICRNGAPLRASRWASLSVARSPTRAATRWDRPR
jgi:ankyrin repeat protein